MPTSHEEDCVIVAASDGDHQIGLVFSAMESHVLLADPMRVVNAARVKRNEMQTCEGRA